MASMRLVIMARRKRVSRRAPDGGGEAGASAGSRSLPLAAGWGGSGGPNLALSVELSRWRVSLQKTAQIARTIGFAQPAQRPVLDLTGARNGNVDLSGHVLERLAFKESGLYHLPFPMG